MLVGAHHTDNVSQRATNPESSLPVAGAATTVVRLNVPETIAFLSLLIATCQAPTTASSLVRA